MPDRLLKIFDRIVILFTIIFICGLSMLCIASWNPVKFNLASLDLETDNDYPLNLDDPFIASLNQDFRFNRALPEYDLVIAAIEKYRLEQGKYPAELVDLVSDHLKSVPEIYLPNGETLTYSPDPLRAQEAPFQFSIRGHYSGLASIHGWELYYCPVEYPGCNDEGDRHIGRTRINDDWIWISSSAL